MITVGIPYTNQGEMLAFAIRSVLDQTLNEFELIIYGDAPDTLTREIAESFSDKRIRHYQNTLRQGLPYTLNEITKLASYPLLARMDGDDIMHPRRLELQAKFMGAHTNCDLVGSRAYVINENGTLLGNYQESELPTTPRGFLANGVFTHPTILGRTEWFRSNPYSQRFPRAEDKELWLRTNETSRFYKMDEALLYYRIHSRVNRKKQGEDARNDRQVMRAYKHLDSSYGMLRRQLTSITKQAVVACLDAVGLTSIIHKTKYSQIPNDDYIYHATVLKEIQERALQYIDR